MGLDEGGQVGRGWGGESFCSLVGFEVYLCAVESLAVEEEFFEQAGRHSFVHEAEHQGGVGAVEFVAHERVADSHGVDADLVASSGFWMDLSEGITPSSGEGDELGFGGVAAFCAVRDCGAAGVEFGSEIGADAGGGGDGVFEVACQNGVVGLVESFELDGALEAGAGFAGSGEDEDAAGFAVEAEGHAEDVVAEVFAAGSDEAGPGAEAGTVDDDVRGLVDEEDVWSFFQNPAT